ncbi:MAG TPA: glycerophosphodiester phosphodiesterase [bacterium]
MMIFAHRGNSSVAPENTMAAFRAAQEAGAAGIEFDVQLTKDGVPIVIHDERVDRTTSGKGGVVEQTLTQLQALDAGAWFNPSFAGERLPTLAQLLEHFRGSSMWLNIELKTNRLPYPGLVPAVLKLVEQFGMQQQVILSSFNHNTLKEVQTLAPRIECAALVSDALVEPWTYARQHGFQGIHPYFSQIDEALMEGCRAVGLAVRAWTVDEAPAAEQLKALGVAAVITNKPRDLRPLASR